MMGGSRPFVEAVTGFRTADAARVNSATSTSPLNIMIFEEQMRVRETAGTPRRRVL